MVSRALLAFFILGCSSSTHTSNKPSAAGGSSSAGGAGSYQDGDSGFDSGDTSQCPVWPQAKLFPRVGPFFYGPDLGPCSYTETDHAPGALQETFTLFYTYNDSGEAVTAASPSSDTLHYIYNYTYNQGLLATYKSFAAGLSTSATFDYGTDTAGYYVFDANGNPQSRYDYSLDSQGYPTTVTYSLIVNGQRTTPTSGAVRLEYEYANCQIQNGITFLADGTTSTANYTYDSLGHLIDVSSTDVDVSFDYSCWANQSDASQP